ncbi:MAG TPA: chromate efflux transporter [Usitatibacter sp.]|jgi:chromate transporter|nr:chromate efflux transporter [Usitatibacter sp.]
MEQSARGPAREVFATFLRLGLTSFGGPIAHLGYFRRELVERRRWVSEAQFAEVLGLCQFLPGPASSQLGFSLGLMRAGWLGAFAAFVGFTLPSALLLYAFARVLPMVPAAIGATLVHGLKLVAVAVVAHGVVGMARQLCPDAIRASIAALAAFALLAFGTAWMQVLVVIAGGLAGLVLCRAARAPRAEAPPLPHGRRAGFALLAAYALLLALLPLAAAAFDGAIGLAWAFYRAGALVFGGGHVVLPLLQQALVDPGWLTRDEFLAGYGAAQAVPGPMFTLAAYLGARIAGGAGAALALGAIFLPGFLLVSAALPLWRSLAAHPAAARAVAGVNAAVVGLLAAALYDPVWVSAIRSPFDVGIAIIGFTLLAAWRAPALAVVAWCVAASFAVT